MTVLDHPPFKTPEDFVKRERELAVWSYPHFVRYLRALIYKLTPAPHHNTQMILDAADEILTGQSAPRWLGHLYSTPPSKVGPGRAARDAANRIVAVVNYWAGFEALNKVRVHTDAHDTYHRALREAKDVECDILDHGYLTPADLYACAILANNADADADHRDAAQAAMSAGHFRLAYDIATRGEND